MKGRVTRPIVGAARRRPKPPKLQAILRRAGKSKRPVTLPKINIPPALEVVLKSD